MNEEAKETKVIPLFDEAGEMAVEHDTWRKSIPAQVFLNHYFGIHYHVRNTPDAWALHDVPAFARFDPELSGRRLDEAKRMLLNCWNTEYALRSTAANGDEQYLRNALHWTFPQAYYSVLFGVRAFLATQGLFGNSDDLIRLRVGRLVANGFYPRAIGFYASGHYGDFKTYRLSVPGVQPSLSLVGNPREAQAQVAQFLRTTRTMKAKQTRQEVQANPNTALRSEKTGNILMKFDARHWQKLTPKLGFTTFFDLMGRLKISANYREIERFVEADINFKLFHFALGDLVSYLNFIHESYVAQAMDGEAYREFIGTLPDYLRNGFVRERYETRIKPVLTVLREREYLQAA
jgi:hypothetical protein